jgi:hypothetical protein
MRTQVTLGKNEIFKKTWWSFLDNNLINIAGEYV